MDRKPWYEISFFDVLFSDQSRDKERRSKVEALLNDPAATEGEKRAARAALARMDKEEHMAEFCLECWNKLNEDNLKDNDVEISTDFTLCEGCNEMKNVVLKELNKP